MIHNDSKTLQNELEAAGISADGTLEGGRTPAGELIDTLVYTAVFAEDDGVRRQARAVIHGLARSLGAIPASIQPLYEAIGRGEVTGFTAPAHNIRTLTYDTARALFRAAIRHDVGAFLFEIARSEIGYTEQRPAEYSACVLGAAIREGYRGPVFIQGDHFQASARKWKTDEAGETRAIEALIDEAIAAEFYNIDIDTSTLVDLDLPTRDDQQRVNYEGAAHFTRYIRAREPEGVEISIGGEIGEVGKHNTSPDEFRAYMDGYNRLIGSMKGISKISIQTGTSHGGVPLADGSIAEAKIDFGVLEEISRIGRSEYGIAGSVQHGASTLPEEVFDNFPKHETVEIHLATGFQNMVYDNAKFPASMKAEILAWCSEHCADERKPDETDEQFLYKARKKALGPFKKALWHLPEEIKSSIIGALEDKFAFLFGKLGVIGTRETVLRHVPTGGKNIPRYQAASNELTAAALVDPNEGE